LNANLRTTHLRIEGMTCGSCARHVGDALRAVPGVASVDVRLRDGAADVRHDASDAPVSALLEAVADAGYETGLQVDP
jgi:copper chaperone